MIKFYVTLNIIGKIIPKLSTFFVEWEKRIKNAIPYSSRAFIVIDQINHCKSFITSLYKLFIQLVLFVDIRWVFFPYRTQNKQMLQRISILFPSFVANHFTILNVIVRLNEWYSFNESINGLCEYRFFGWNNLTEKQKPQYELDPCDRWKMLNRQCHFDVLYSIHPSLVTYL